MRPRVASLASLLLAWSPALVFAGQASAPAPCAVTGTITSSGQPLPGVAVTIAAGGQEVGRAASGVDGTYSVVLRSPAADRYTIAVDLPGFAASTRDVAVDAAACPARADFALDLASRAPKPAPAATPTATAPGPAEAAAAPPTSTPAAGSQPPIAMPRRARMPAAGAGAAGGGFRGTEITTDRAALQQLLEQEATGGGNGIGDQQIPAGFGGDAATESVTTFGRTDRVGEFQTLRDRLDGRPEGEGPGGANQPPGFGPSPFANLDLGGGGPGGPGGGFLGGRAIGGPGGGVFFGGPGGGGPGGGGPGGGGFGGPGGPGGGGFGGGNRLRGSFFDTLGGSFLDADPYPLNGADTRNPDYVRQRFGVTLGGPLKLPGMAASSRTTSFFVNYSGNHSTTPFDSYSTVPSAAARAGDFSAGSAAIVDPLTGVPFAGNVIPAARISPTSASLLALVPLPNLPGDRQNFHYLTTTTTHRDDLSVRLTHRFGTPPTPGQRGAGGGRRGGAGGTTGGGRGAGGGRGFNTATVLNVTISYQHGTGDVNNAFPTLGGERDTQAWNVPVSLSFATHGFVNNVSARLNHNRSATRNLFAGTRDVAGEAGITGVSTDPFDWGAPTLSFSSLTSLRDVTPSDRIDQGFSISDTVVRTFQRRHTLRFGGAYSQSRLDSHTSASARGSFVFTGLYSRAALAGATSAASGNDFADYLLGLAQQASVQFGPGELSFRSRAMNLFVQDDWRVNGSLTLNAGLRYEYVSPFTESDNHLSNLDVAPDFSAAVPVEAGQSGPYSGALPDSLVRSDWNNLAPRIGFAWRARTNTVVRGGYGINYSSDAYRSIVQRLAAQPPFATSATSLGSALVAVPVTDPLALAGDTAALNDYAIDPAFVLGVAQQWNLDLQHTFDRGLLKGFLAAASYNGTKGSRLDLQRAPNRGPDGLLIDGVPPYIFETSAADSILHSLTVRVRRRMSNGMSAGGSYTFSKSIDDASSIGGGAASVAQNDRDLAAERARSNFDRRHQFSADAIYELPFGPQRRWLNDGWLSHVLANWQVNGTFSIASGTPYTARILGDSRDVSRGTNGTLRADVTGLPVALADPSLASFFAIDAFAVPLSGTFGNAGRNTIIGPGTHALDAGLTRSFTLGTQRVLSARLQATNVLNSVQFAAIDTVVNSPTFGQVVSIRPMRSVQFDLRFRF